MKINKIFKNLFQQKQLSKMSKSIPPCPIEYNPKNVTAKEFKEYIHWLSENNINRTVYEPDKFVTEAERNAINKKKSDTEKYRKFLKYLAENNINRTFYC